MWKVIIENKKNAEHKEVLFSNKFDMHRYLCILDNSWEDISHEYIEWEEEEDDPMI